GLDDSPPGSMASVAVSEQSAPVPMGADASVEQPALSAPAEPADPALSMVDAMPPAAPVEPMPAPPATESLPEKPVKRQVEPRAEAIPVQVDVRPWGEVFVNGASRGVSPPLRSLALLPGVYQVRIVNGDLPAGRVQL